MCSLDFDLISWKLSLITYFQNFLIMLENLNYNNGNGVTIIENNSKYLFQKIVFYAVTLFMERIHKNSVENHVLSEI